MPKTAAKRNNNAIIGVSLPPEHAMKTKAAGNHSREFGRYEGGMLGKTNRTGDWWGSAGRGSGFFSSGDFWEMEGFFRDTGRRGKGHGQGLACVGRLLGGPLKTGCRWK